MTAPLDPKSFPVLPPGLYFEVEFHSIDRYDEQRLYDVTVKTLKKNKAVVWETAVGEDELAVRVGSLAKLAHLKVTEESHLAELDELNKKLKRAASVR